MGYVVLRVGGARHWTHPGAAAVGLPYAGLAFCQAFASPFGAYLLRVVAFRREPGFWPLSSGLRFSASSVSFARPAPFGGDPAAGKPGPLRAAGARATGIPGSRDSRASPSSGGISPPKQLGVGSGRASKSPDVYFAHWAHVHADPRRLSEVQPRAVAFDTLQEAMGQREEQGVRQGRMAVVDGRTSVVKCRNPIPPRGRVYNVKRAGLELDPGSIRKLM